MNEVFPPNAGYNVTLPGEHTFPITANLENVQAAPAAILCLFSFRTNSPNEPE